MRRTLMMAAAITATFSYIASAQDEGELRIRKALEGREVIVKMDMPAIDAGVYMYFDDAAVSFDKPKYDQLLKEFGTSIKQGSRARITGVRVTGRGIELDLDGGGSPDRDWVVGNIRLTEPSPVAKSDRELELERRLQQENAPGVASFLRNEIDHERDRRLSQDERNRQAFARVASLRSSYIEENRKNWGSKLIVSIRSRKPSVTIRDMIRSLSQYVEILPRDRTVK